ncbi:MAG: hypothetical protein KAR62_02710 [Sphingomonadales bacterium]|nr:hypothetical protein [Sphingomonadales bacterium]
MFKRRSGIGLKGVSVKIELPIEIAEYILENADGLLSTIKQSVEAEKKRFDNSSLAVAYHSPDKQEEWEKLARYTDREARRRYKQNKEPFTSVISGVAKELGVPYTSLLAIVTSYRERRSYGLYKRREVVTLED